MQNWRKFMTKTEMSVNIFVRAISELIMPLFPGMKINGEIKDLPKYDQSLIPIVANYKGSTSLRLMPYKGVGFGIEVYRKQSFSADDKSFINCLLKKAMRIYQSEDKYNNEILKSVTTEAICEYVCSRSDFFYNLVLTLTDWAETTYEGQRISVSFGIDLLAKGTDLVFNDLMKKDFIKVLSNGHDSIMVYDQMGRFIKHEVINSDNQNVEGYYPIRFKNLASWSNEQKICVTLTKNGDILIFKKNNIVFSKRMGYWTFYQHDTVQKQMTNSALARKTDIILREEIYRTALDLAFSRTGGCIGVFVNSETLDGTKDLIEEQELLGVESMNPKVKILEQIICKKLFHQLDRITRLELASIDGATILDNKGNYIASGVIVKVKGGSSSGGRKAATLALCKHGLGIKISNDGYIEAYNRNKELIFKIGN